MKVAFRSKKVQVTKQYVYLNGHKFELYDLIETLEEALDGVADIRITNERLAKVLKDVGVLLYEGRRENPARFDTMQTQLLLVELRARCDRIEGDEDE